MSGRSWLVVLMVALLAPGCDDDGADGVDVIPETHPALDGRAARAVVGAMAFTAKDGDGGFIHNLGGGFTLSLRGAANADDRLSFERVSSLEPGSHPVTGTNAALAMRLDGVELSSAHCDASTYPEASPPVFLVQGREDGVVWGGVEGTVCADPSEAAPEAVELEDARFSAWDV